ADRPASCPRPARRLALSTYPFSRERHWIGPAVAPRSPDHAPESPPPAPALPPAPAPGVVEHVRRLYARVSGIPVERLDPDVSLEGYGLTSALVMQLNEALECDFGEVSRTLFFEHPTLAEVAAHLSVRRGAPAAGAVQQGPAARAAEPLADDRPGPESSTQDIAIVGI